MAVWNEINLQNVEGAIRLDAEYYQPQYFEIVKSIQRLGSQPLSFFASPSRKMFSQKGLSEFRYVEISRVSTTDGSVEAITIPIEETPSRAQYIINTNDIIISTVRPERNAVGLITEELNNSVCSSGFQVLTPNKDLASEYLFAYLKSKPIIELLSRRVTASMYPAVTESDIFSLPFFIPSSSIYNEIVSSVKESLELRGLSKTLYQEAEALLLHELGLDTLDLSDEITYERNFDDVAFAGRLDAQHFQPKYYRVLDAIKAIKPLQIVNLDSLLEEITNGQTPLHHDLSVGDVRFLTAEHIYDYRINYDSDKRVETEHHEKQLKKTQIKENDVLITIKGRIGNVAIVEDVPFPTNINQDVGLLRLKENIHPYYIAGFLNSQAGKALTEQVCTGQINPFLGLGNLRTVQIPIFKTERMNELGEMIKAKVNEATQTQQSAKQLLEDAKRRVEDMILGA